MKTNLGPTEGLAVRPDGFALVSDVIAKAKCSVAELKSVVSDSDKQRFALITIDGKEYVRANQGHSFPVPDLDLKRITSVDEIPKGENSAEGVVVHGTYKKAWDQIKKTGLSKMNRNHIHFAIGTPGESHVISGMRSSCQVLIYVDVAKALADGLDFFISENNVVLSGGNADGFIPTTYFRAVLDAETNQPFDTDFPGSL